MATELPYGVNSENRLVHVSDVPNGRACACDCPGCKAPLIARQGRIRVWHFAHDNPAPECESWLHATAKRLFAQTIMDGIQNGTPVWARFECEGPRCGSGRSHKVDLLGKGRIAGAELERWDEEHKRKPDITLVNRDGHTVAWAEIVAAHTPDYDPSAVGKPVLLFRVEDSSSLKSLVARDILVTMYGYPCLNPCCDTCGRPREGGCSYCKDCGAHRGAVEIPAWNIDYGICWQCFRRTVLATLKQMKQSTGLNLRKWENDKFGNPLNYGLPRELLRQAELLVALGYQQSAKRPSLFVRIGNGVKVYADLDSTDVLPIWKTRGPALYGFPLGGERDRQVDLAQWELLAMGIEARFYFFESHNRWHDPAWFSETEEVGLAV